MSIAVIINNEELDEATIAKVKEIVAYSAGVDQENVNVSPMQFSGQEEIVAKIEEAMAYEANKFPIEITENLILGTIAILFTFILSMVLLRTFRTPRKKVKLSTGNAQIGNDERIGIEEKKGTNYSENNRKMVEELQEIEVDKNSEYYIKKEIDKFIDKRAEDVAQLLKTWIVED